MRSRISTLLAVALIAVTLGASAASSSIGIHLSDIHLDIYFGTKDAQSKACSDATTPWYGAPGCDSSHQMMESTMADVAATIAESGSDETPIIYYTGDWLRHDMTRLKDPSKAGILTFETIANAFKKNFAAINATLVLHPAMAVNLGNEDFIPDYHFNVSNAGNDALLAGMASALKQSGLLSAAEAETFAYCGYTSKVINRTSSAAAPIRVLMLNSLVWTDQMKPATTEADPCGQLAWMRTELESANASGQVVHVQSHIPPDLVFWKGSYFAAYQDLLTEYSGICMAQFFGHIHRFAFQSATPNAQGAVMAPIFIGGPVTRASNTNPDYSIMRIDSRTGAITDRVQRYLNLTAVPNPTWVTGQSLKAAIGAPTLTAVDLHAASLRMMNTSDPVGNAEFQNYYTMFQGGLRRDAADTCTGLCQRLMCCVTINLDLKDTFECQLLRGPEYEDLAIRHWKM